MAWSARYDDDKRELFDKPEIIEKKAENLAEMIKKARYCVFFTGAGISTSTGIPDFRSGMDTKLACGPGFWELQADYNARTGGVRNEATKNDPARPKIDLDQMAGKQPSATHVAIAKLVDAGLVKFVISQNVDNLHRRSGIPQKKLSEMHGNLFIEYCERCWTEYPRAYRVGPNGHNPTGLGTHYTGRKCTKAGCNGMLKDFLVPFGEGLPDKETQPAWDASERCDLCVAVGSSLTVTPACDYASWCVERPYASAGQSAGKLAIINLQPTPKDPVATMRLNGFCDDVMIVLMEKLGMPLKPEELPVT